MSKLEGKCAGYRSRSSRNLAGGLPWKALSALSVEDDADEKPLVLPPISDPLSSADEHTHLRRECSWSGLSFHSPVSGILC